MGPMNAEAPASEAILATEALVSRVIFRRHQDRPEEAAELFEAALERDPEHLEALAQLSMVAANELNRPDRARMALSRLMGLLRAGDPRLASVEIALNRLTAGE